MCQCQIPTIHEKLQLQQLLLFIQLVPSAKMQNSKQKLLQHSLRLLPTNTFFLHENTFIRIIAQIKHVNQKSFLMCLFICVFKFPACLFYFSPVCLFMCVLKLPARDDAQSHWFHLFDFSPVCVFMCVLNLLASKDAYSQCLHLLDLSLVCVFMCVLKLPARDDAQSHWLHLFDFSPVCLFICALKLRA